MRKNFPLTLGVLGLTAMLAACSNNSTPVSNPEVSAPAEHQIASMGSLKYVQNEVVVGYEDQASLDAAVKAMGGTLLRSIPEIKVALVQVSGDALKVAGRAKVDGVRYASPNAVVMPDRETPTLGSASLSAQAANPDQIFDALPQYALDPRHLNAKAAWDKGLTGKGVTVAVIDDPGDVTHPDLAANWAGKAFDPRQNKVYTDGQAWKAYVQKPDNDHGTFVASSIVASKNGKGIVGVAYDAKWMPVIMFNPGSYSSFEIALGAVWATNNGARAINNLGRRHQLRAGQGRLRLRHGEWHHCGRLHGQHVPRRSAVPGRTARRDRLRRTGRQQPQGDVQHRRAPHFHGRARPGHHAREPHLAGHQT